jgi:tetratricopeptide (TPR) repeat protein
LYKRGDFAAALERIGQAKAGFSHMGAAILTLNQKKLRSDIDRAQEMSDYGSALNDWYQVASCMKNTVQSWMIENEKKMSDNEKGIQEKMSGGPKDVVPAEYQYFAGNCLFKMKRLDEAAVAYEGALAVDPTHANACNNLINILYVQKRIEDARAWLARAEKAKVKIHPGLKKAVLEN